MRIWRELEDVITSVMPSVKHEVTSRTILAEVLPAIARIRGHDTYSVRGLGSTRFHAPGKRRKEGYDGGLGDPLSLSVLGLSWCGD